MLQNTLIVFPFLTELKPVLSTLENAGWQFEKSSFGSQSLFTSSDSRITLATTGQGKTQMALEVQALLSTFSFDSVLGSGCCGALNPHAELFDLGLTQQVIEHDFKTCIKDNPFPTFIPSSELHSLLQQKWDLPLVTMASGDETIDSLTRKQNLREQTAADFVCWESSGLARACERAQIPWAEVRMVSDLCELTNFKELKRRIQQGMPQIGELILKLFLS